MTAVVSRLLILVLLLVCGPGLALARAQDAAGPPPPAAALRVFLDCPRCDDDYVRQNVGFVDYVRDRAVADVHVLVTAQDTGGGGLSWGLKFIGIGDLQGRDRLYDFTTDQTATRDDQRRAFARVFKIGLLAYLPDGQVLPDLDVTWKASSASAVTHDPWNYWVFRLSGNGFGNGQKRSRSLSSYGSVSASRTTDAWKVQLSTNGNLRTNTFDLEDQGRVTSRRGSWDVNALVVRSLGPKWSFGGTSAASHSSFSNIDRAVMVAPGIEYNFFPYSESSRRSLAIQYTLGVVHNAYVDRTILGRTEDTFARQGLKASLGLRQPWGSLNVASRFSQQLNDLARFRESISGDCDIRLFKGFSFNIYTEYEKISDLISLRQDTASDTAVLLGTQQLETSYGYFISFGLSYSFGSIFNSIVNPRFTF